MQATYQMAVFYSITHTLLGSSHLQFRAQRTSAIRLVVLYAQRLRRLVLEQLSGIWLQAAPCACQVVA